MYGRPHGPSFLPFGADGRYTIGTSTSASSWQPATDNAGCEESDGRLMGLFSFVVRYSTPLRVGNVWHQRGFFSALPTRWAFDIGELYYRLYMAWIWLDWASTEGIEDNET